MSVLSPPDTTSKKETLHAYLMFVYTDVPGNQIIVESTGGSLNLKYNSRLTGQDGERVRASIEMLMQEHVKLLLALKIKELGTKELNVIK
ncbi:hypothetical protein Tco_0506080 [Tanacetum coccineum]